eukprot:scaffold69255_cov66-Phaeocystis_antarctica.AAC.4
MNASSVGRVCGVKIKKYRGIGSAVRPLPSSCLAVDSLAIRRIRSLFIARCRLSVDFSNHSTARTMATFKVRDTLEQPRGTTTHAAHSIWPLNTRVTTTAAAALRHRTTMAKRLARPKC